MDQYVYPLMESRYIDLQQVLEGYNRTGVPLVAVESGKLAAAAPADDIGIFYFIPEIVRHLHVSLDQGITIFFLGIIAISFLAGLIGCFLWLKKPIMRGLAIFGLGCTWFLMFFMIEEIGVYAICACTVVLVVPLFMYFIKQNRFGAGFYIFLAFTGLAMGLAHIIRAHSGTSTVILIFAIIWFSRTYPLKIKLFASGVMIIFMLIPSIFLNALISQRDTYLAKEIPGYVSVPASHTFWHQVYICMGYIQPNKYGIVLGDIAGFNKAREIDPNVVYRSAHYSEILKGEVLRIASEDPGFIAKLLFLKTAKMLLVLIMCANIGLIAMVLRPKPLNIELGFWLAIGFGALFGILTLPWVGYILSFIAMCMMYAIASVDYY
ncbi:MAG: hypothetical protein NTY09_10300, partial [bacterium]|nr:hypothetical protein [bacterium]